jgi:hypothetical protein
MDQLAQSWNNLTTALELYYMRILAINLIIAGPIISGLSQVALAIREIAINTRKEYSSDEYDSLKWIAEIFFYLGWLVALAGVLMLVKVF